MPTDVDGVVRSYQVVSRLSKTENSIWQFPLYIIIDLLGVQESDIKLKIVKSYSRTVFKSLLTVREHSGLIGWVQKIKSGKYLFKVLNKIVPAEYFKDKVIFLARALLGWKILKQYLIPKTGSRVDIHVTAFLNMINQAWIKEVSFKILSFWHYWPVWSPLFVYLYWTLCMPSFGWQDPAKSDLFDLSNIQ